MPFTFPDGSKPGVCNICFAPSWSPRSNKCEEHRPVPTEKKPRKKAGAKKEPKPRVNADGSAKPVVTQVVESAGAIDSRTFSGKPPTASEWEDKLGSLVVLLTMTYVEYAVVKPLRLPEEDATRAVAYLGMTSEEAQSIIEPCAYLLAGSSINKKHGREAIEVIAFAPAILAIVAWADRVSSFRREMQALQGGDSNVSSIRAQTPPGASTTAGGAPIANFRGNTNPDEAPTARVNRNSNGLDDEAQSVAT